MISIETDAGWRARAYAINRPITGSLSLCVLCLCVNKQNILVATSISFVPLLLPKKTAVFVHSHVTQILEILPTCTIIKIIIKSQVFFDSHGSICKTIDQAFVLTRN